MCILCIRAWPYAYTRIGICVFRVCFGSLIFERYCSFEKDFFKLMNNSVFGKTMENLRERANIHLVTDEEQLNRLTRKPTFVSFKIFDENLVGVQMKR